MFANRLEGVYTMENYPHAQAEDCLRVCGIRNGYNHAYFAGVFGFIKKFFDPTPYLFVVAVYMGAERTNFVFNTFFG